MSLAEKIIAVLSILGLGSALPTIGNAIREFFRGKTQADVSIALSDRELFQKQITAVQSQADEMFLELRKVQESYTHLAIEKGMAVFERDQALKREIELMDTIRELKIEIRNLQKQQVK